MLGTDNDILSPFCASASSGKLVIDISSLETDLEILTFGNHRVTRHQVLILSAKASIGFDLPTSCHSEVLRALSTTCILTALC